MSKKIVLSDDAAYNALASWILDTDADSFSTVFGEVFGVTVNVVIDRKKESVSFECTPIDGKYMGGLE